MEHEVEDEVDLDEEQAEEVVEDEVVVVALFVMRVPPMRLSVRFFLFFRPDETVNRFQNRLPALHGFAESLTLIFFLFPLFSRSLLEAGQVQHDCESELVCKWTIPEKVPYFNAGVYLQNKKRIGKVDEILGKIAEVMFTVKMDPGVVSKSFQPDDLVYIGTDKLLPLSRFTNPSGGGGRSAGRGGRGGGRGAGGRGGGGRGGRGGRSFGGRGGRSPGRGGGRGFAGRSPGRGRGRGRF